MPTNAKIVQISPTKSAPYTVESHFEAKKEKPNVIGMTAPRTKLGTVEVAVARIFVPNCSDAIVTNKAQ